MHNIALGRYKTSTIIFVIRLERAGGSKPATSALGGIAEWKHAAWWCPLIIYAAKGDWKTWYEMLTIYSYHCECFWLSISCVAGPGTQSWVVGAGGQPEPRVSKELMCSKLRHHRTFRGHSSAVYVLAIDHDSRYVLSGSDDAVMKIWSLSTGVLLNSCRGHEVCDRIPFLACLEIVFRCSAFHMCSAAFRERLLMSRSAATPRWQPVLQQTQSSVCGHWKLKLWGTQLQCSWGAQP